MVMLVQYVRTRWLSKFLMMNSLIANKAVIRAMCASEDEECQVLHGKDLTDAEWKLLEVSDLVYMLLAYQIPAKFPPVFHDFCRSDSRSSRNWLKLQNLWRASSTSFLLLFSLHCILLKNSLPLSLWIHLLLLLSVLLCSMIIFRTGSHYLMH
jgi:hypothetical protein